MADNIQTNTGSGGPLIATEEIEKNGTDCHAQDFKLLLGADGENDGPVSAANPMPVELSDDSQVIAALRAGVLYDTNGNALTINYAKIDGATSGNNEIVAAVVGKKILVLSFHATMTGTAVTIRFESGADGTALTGQMQPSAGNSVDAPFSPVGHFITAANQSLNMELSGAQSVDGWLVYVLVD